MSIVIWRNWFAVSLSNTHLCVLFLPLHFVSWLYCVYLFCFSSLDASSSSSSQEHMDSSFKVLVSVELLSVKTSPFFLLSGPVNTYKTNNLHKIHAMDKTKYFKHLAIVNRRKALCQMLHNLSPELGSIIIWIEITITSALLAEIQITRTFFFVQFQLVTVM